MSLLFYYHTIKYLKLRQIFYQLLFPLRKIYNSVSTFNKYKDYVIRFIPINYLPNVDSTKGSGNLIFNYLNISHDFGNSIDWNINKFGKLWNFNLQYLEFLLEDHLELDERIVALRNISEKILDRTLKLEAYPVSLRLINELLFINKYQIHDSVIDLAIKKQIHFLTKNLEYHIDANHLLENAIALRFSTLFLNNEQLVKKSRKLLIKILREQIFIDGGHYERSPMYHLQLLNHLCILIGAMPIKDSDYKFLESVTVKMWSWINQITNNGKIMPYLQDSTGNYLHQYHSIKPFLESISTSSELIKLTDSKYRIIQNDNFRLIFNCGNANPSFQPGHAHSDELGIVLYRNSEPILVDPGISTYEIGNRRSNEKGSTYHNTIVINELNHSELWSSFRMARRSKVLISKDSNHLVEAELSPYHSLNSIIQRQISVASNGITIIDRVKGSNIGTSIAYFHCNYLSIPQQLDKGSFLVNDCRIQFDNYSKIHIFSYQQSLDFNVTKEAKCIAVEFETQLITTINV